MIPHFYAVLLAMVVPPACPLGSKKRDTRPQVHIRHLLPVSRTPATPPRLEDEIRHKREMEAVGCSGFLNNGLK
jgi:hypothetical protein